MKKPGKHPRGFTLVELLVVIALIAGLSAFFIGGLRDSKTAALQTAQAVVANMLTAARTRALATGRQARVLIHVDDASPMAPARYLRYFVLQSSDGSNWTTESDAYLPNGAYVVPRDPTAVAGLLPAEVAWTRPSDGDTLRSTSLRQSDETSVAVASSIAEHWAAIVFSSRGSTADQFALVLATGRRSQGPGSPVTLDDPDSVRGFAISAYGVTALVNGRSGF